MIFSKTAGFVHQSIPDGIKAIQAIGTKEGYDVDVTVEDSVFTEENLAQYAAVVFLNTTGDVLPSLQELVFERYIQAGGGFVGVHAATDTEYGWRWYGRLVGAYFDSHPRIQEAQFKVEDHDCSACSALKEDIWTRTDELYNFKDVNPDVHVILSIDENSYEGGNMNNKHPMSWYHEFEGGRAFYTALGHTSESYTEPAFLAHLTDGIKYAIGENAKPDYSKCITQLPPNQARFTKKTLVTGEFTEPTEMAILPNEDVLIAQRRGEVMLYKAATKTLKQVGYLDVYHQSGVQGVNAEEGLMGLQKDPDFANNHWVYLFYSPKGDEWVNRLSRFKFEDDTLKLDTEQKILDVGSQRLICCHTGGSIAFGPDNMLYLSTGDNSTPFNDRNSPYSNNGFAPLNDAPGKEQYDARRSSGNTNDLRGKVLRIKVNEDGAYSIPEGNLFPVGTEKTRPEIFTMGHRNPYRISVDPKNGTVFWGEVGPDAQNDSMAVRGPRGYDEVNMARKAGNFGWPLFIANSLPYHDYDYETGVSGPAFDPAAPINDSRNNTGLQQLPPTQHAMIYYPYGVSNVFAELESGGRNAMAGPIYYKDLYTGKDKLPEYYDKKLIIYDWIRGWMKAVSFFEDGEMRHIEPFANEVKVHNLIDMELSEDGKIYLLEYGSGWFSKNADSGLSILEFNAGNLPPKIEDFEVDVASGKAPLNTVFQVKASDIEEGKLSYKWHLSEDKIQETTVPTLEYTFETPGFYSVYVEVVDDNNQSVISKKIPIVSGNTKPKVMVELEGTNSQIMLPGVPVRYKVTVTDDEDGEIDTDRVTLNVDYLEGFDEASLSPVGHQEVSGAELGKAYIENGTCIACHKENEKSIGPSYKQVADRYQGQRRSRSVLMAKIKGGGAGNWGEVAMPANADLTNEDLSNIMEYIFSLATSNTNRMPLAGTLTPPSDQTGKTLVMTASYKDKGGDNVIALTGMERKRLRSNLFSMEEATDLENFSTIKFNGQTMLPIPNGGGAFALKNMDLTSVGEIVLPMGWMVAPNLPITISVHKNTADGEVLGEGTIQPGQAKGQSGSLHIPLNKAVNEKVDKLFFVYRPEESEKLSPGVVVALTGVQFMPRMIQ
ncbi:MAG: ThuA domain-containing protein [Saprospiraceae bacterium]